MPPLAWDPEFDATFKVCKADGTPLEFIPVLMTWTGRDIFQHQAVGVTGADGMVTLTGLEKAGTSFRLKTVSDNWTKADVVPVFVVTGLGNSSV